MASHKFLRFLIGCTVTGALAGAACAPIESGAELEAIVCDDAANPTCADSAEIVVDENS